MVSKVSVDLTTPIKEAILQTAAFADLLLAYMEQPSRFELENASVADWCVKPNFAKVVCGILIGTRTQNLRGRSSLLLVLLIQCV